MWIPMYAIHYDPEMYENPEKFDPERFSDENKHKIKSRSYIPFGKCQSFKLKGDHQFVFLLTTLVGIILLTIQFYLQVPDLL